MEVTLSPAGAGVCAIDHIGVDNGCGMPGLSRSAGRVGIIGFGLSGRVFHAPLIEAVDGLELAAIVTGDPERRAQAAAAHPAARVVASVDELWGLVDLVVVAAPNRAHVGLARAAIDRGLAVVVDKPLAPSAGAAESLLAAGGRLTVFQNRRWDGDFLTATRLVRDGTLGGVTRLESRYERFRPSVSLERWREQPDPAEGGGLLLDLGAHLVDQACRLFGPPVGVYAEIDIRRPGGQVEDDVFVALLHGGRERSHLWMSFDGAAGRPAPAHQRRGGGLRDVRPGSTGGAAGGRPASGGRRVRGGAATGPTRRRRRRAGDRARAGCLPALLRAGPGVAGGRGAGAGRPRRQSPGPTRNRGGAAERGDGPRGRGLLRRRPAGGWAVVAAGWAVTASQVAGVVPRARHSRRP